MNAFQSDMELKPVLPSSFFLSLFFFWCLEFFSCGILSSPWKICFTAKKFAFLQIILMPETCTLMTVDDSVTVFSPVDDDSVTVQSCG